MDYVYTRTNQVRCLSFSAIINDSDIIKDDTSVTRMNFQDVASH